MSDQTSKMINFFLKGRQAGHAIFIVMNVMVLHQAHQFLNRRLPIKASKCQNFLSACLKKRPIPPQTVIFSLSETMAHN